MEMISKVLSDIPAKFAVGFVFSCLVAPVLWADGVEMRIIDAPKYESTTAMVRFDWAHPIYIVRHVKNQLFGHAGL